MASIKAGASPAKQVGIRAALALFGLGLAALTLELPAMLGWVDHRYTVGLAQREVHADRKGMDAHTRVHHSLAGDLVPVYDIQNPVLRTIDFRTDRYGLRNPTDRDRATVIIVGDSFVHNTTVAGGKTFPRQLEKKLGVDVTNLGHSGWGPSEELDAFQRIGLALHPKVAVWAFYEGNDLSDILTRPLPQARWYDTWFVTNVYLRAGVFLPHILWSYTNDWSADHSTSGSCTLRCPTPPCETMYMGHLADRLTAAEEFALQRTYDALLQAQQIAREHAVELWLAFAPVKLRVYHNACDLDPDYLAAKASINDLPQRMAQWADTRHIPFIDLTAALQRAAQHGEAVYWPDDTHWSERGNEVVAEELGQWLGAVKADR